MKSDQSTERERIARLQLSFAGWLPAPDNEPIGSDDWHTPPELVHEIAEFFGGSIDLDPCWSPLSFVRPRLAYVDPLTPPGLVPDVEGAPAAAAHLFPNLQAAMRDGLAHPWHGRVGETDIRSRFINPPYSQPAPWIRRLDELHRALHPDAAGESMALVRIDTSTMWWQLAWEASAICWLRFRVPFVRPGLALRSQPRDHHALIYWGQHARGFCDSWEWLGHCERPAPMHEPTADELCAQLVDLGHLRIVDGQFALVAESYADEDRREHDLLKIDGIPAETYPFLPTEAPVDECNDGTVDLAVAGSWRFDGACAKHNVFQCATCADAVTVVDEPVVEISPLAENPQAWPVVEPTDEVVDAVDRAVKRHLAKPIRKPRDGGPR